VKLTRYRRSESVSSAAMRDTSASLLAISTPTVPASATVRRRRISSVGTSSSDWGVEAIAFSPLERKQDFASNHVGIIE
jgi:hypothetical protein